MLTPTPNCLLPNFILTLCLLIMFTVYCLPAWLEHTTHFPVHVWLLVHATWLYFTYPFGCFLTTLKPACSDSGAWNVMDPSRGTSLRSESVVDQRWISSFSSSSLLIGCRDSFLLLVSIYQLFVPCKSLCKSYVCTSWWCNIHVILDHPLW